MNDNNVVVEEIFKSRGRFAKPSALKIPQAKPLSKKEVRWLNSKLVKKVQVENESIDSEILTLALEESLNDVSLKDLPPSKEELLDLEMVRIRENYQDALTKSSEQRVNGILLPEIYDSDEGSVERSSDSGEE